MSAVAETSFFCPKNVGFSNPKLGPAVDANRKINWLRPENFAFLSLACFDHRATRKCTVIPHCRINGIYNYFLSWVHTYLGDDLLWGQLCAPWQTDRKVKQVLYSKRKVALFVPFPLCWSWMLNAWLYNNRQCMNEYVFYYCLSKRIS